MKRLLYILALLFVFTSCKKYESLEIHPDYYYVGDNTNLYDAQFLSPLVGYASGGVRDQFGYVYKTKDGGESWLKTPVEYDFCAYSLLILNDSLGWAGGDFARLYKSVDGGQTWLTDWFEADELAVHENHRPAIKRIQYLGDSCITFVSGEDYLVGNIYRSNDMGATWFFDTLNHELRGISYLDKNIGMVSGFGYLGKTIDGGQTWQQIDYDGDFFTGISMLNENDVVACGNNGGIYKSSDGGNSWKQVISSNSAFGKKYAFNDMKFYDNQIGFAVGQSGLIIKTTDAGNSWTLLEANEEEHLNSVKFNGTKVYIAANSGKIVSLNIY